MLPATMPAGASRLDGRAGVACSTKSNPGLFREILEDPSEESAPVTNQPTPARVAEQAERTINGAGAQPEHALGPPWSVTGTARRLDNPLDQAFQLQIEPDLTHHHRPRCGAAGRCTAHELRQPSPLPRPG